LEVDENEIEEAVTPIGLDLENMMDSFENADSDIAY